MEFTHLHVHSDYSIDGLSSVRELVLCAKGLGMEGLALTDHGTLAGVPSFVDCCLREGIKPVIGCEFWITDADCKNHSHLILLAKNRTGYRNLVKLCTLGNCDNPVRGDARPHITKEMLVEHKDGLICTSACIGGAIPQAILAGDMENAEYEARFYKWLFGEDFYLEVSLHRNAGPMKLSPVDDRQAYRSQNRKLVRLQKKSNEGILELGRKLGIKVVATNDVHFAKRADGVAHDVKLAALHGRKVSDRDRLRYSHLEYLKSGEEMLRLFPGHPEVLSNTAEVLSKVVSYDIFSGSHVPGFSQDDQALLRRHALDGAASRYGRVEPSVLERLELELGEYGRLGGGSRLLVLEDLVAWARGNGIAVGPGRGASPSSLVLYCLGITDADPLEAGFLFERFISPGSPVMPDIDLDIEYGQYGRVLDYLKQRYGRWNVSGIATHAAWSKRTAWMVAAKALGLRDRSVRRIASALSDWAPSLASDLEYTPEIIREYRSGDPLVREALDVAARLCGKHRGESGVHSCRILISSDPLPDLVPMETVNGQTVSQYEGNEVSHCGALCQNLIGLQALDLIKEAVIEAEKAEEGPVNPNAAPLDDPDTLRLFSSGDTAGVFLFEPAGLREHLRKFTRLRFQDLVSMDALYRPGPMEWITEYIGRANGSIKADIAPCLRDSLRWTHGMFIFQEQMMMAASEVAGFSPAEADGLRRATCRRDGRAMDAFREKFFEGGAARGHDPAFLHELWHIFRERGMHLFSYTHARCYALLSWRIAWLKAHHPEAFFTALLNTHLRMGWDTDEYVADCKAHGLHVTLPGSNASGLFSVSKQNGSR